MGSGARISDSDWQLGSLRFDVGIAMWVLGTMSYKILWWSSDSNDSG